MAELSRTPERSEGTVGNVESPPPSRRHDEPRSSRPLRLVDERPREVMPSHPPSEPRPMVGRPGADAGPDRPAARVQLIAVLLLLLVLVVVPLYLWRRPRAVSEEADAAIAAASAAPALVATPVAEADAGARSKDGVTLGETKVLACHDPGAKRTAPSACDRLAGFEAALAKAVLDNTTCLPPNTAAGAITYVADVSYGRKHAPVRLSYAREATSVPSKAAAACASEVKKSLTNVALDPTHAHARYEIEIAASYPGGAHTR